MKRLGKLSFFGLVFALLLTLASAPGWAWQQSGPASPPKDKQHSGDIGITTSDAPPKQEKRISPAEAKELFASVDEILEFVSNDTGFPIKHPVKRELASRDVVQKYVEGRLEDDEDAKRLERSELVLKKFGLLPRDFDLHFFLIGLLREQVAGYYDVQTKTINLLDWLDGDAQRPVLAHELTHALQDQNYDLKRWSHPSEARTQKAKAGGKDDRFEYDEDEELMARDAVAEGQGMVVLIDYMLKPTGHTLAESPQFGKIMREAMGKSSNSPMLDKAPMMLRESLIYPYREGLDFEQQLLTTGGKALAFNGAFKDPPQNTHEILAPSAYLTRAAIPPLPIPDLKDVLGKHYEKYDVGSVGEFDVSVILRQYANDDTAAKISSAWRGGSYYAARKLDGQGSKRPASTGDLSILYVSRWATDEAADQFMRAYRSGLGQRYKQVKDAEPNRGCDGSACSSTITTEEGPVIMERLPGSLVLITEGFDANLQRQLKAKLQSDSATQHAATKDLMLRLAQPAIIRQAMENLVLRSVQQSLSRLREHN
jgi:hypothetical protein